ncbi:MAG TPA: hypothetical protein VKU37_11720 [Verrucomicrobiae bacterium]|nr:hypothetical protein [Verrucomicrobiae bacterium]
MSKTFVLVLIIMWLVPGIWLFSKAIVNAVKQRRQQSVLDENEAERLDRLRNPSKYLGK